ENKEKILKEFFDDSDYFDIPKNFYFLKIKHPIVTDDNGANVDIIGFSFQD
ncbi:1640_t:CDS:1, partial [Racocetra fulgida]